MSRQRSCLPAAFRVETEVQKQPQLFQGKIKAVARFNQHLFMQQTYRLRFGKTPSRGRDRTWQQGWRRGLWKGTAGGEVLRGQPLPEIKPLPLKTLLSNRLQVRRSNAGGTIHPQRTRHQAELSWMAGQAWVISVLCATVSSLENWES